MSKHLFRAGALCLLFVAVSAPLHAAFPDTAPDNVFECIAVKTGAWHDATVWSGCGVPTASDDVKIPAPYRVTVQGPNLDAFARFLRVEGEFRLWVHSSTLLEVETIYIASGATFRIGASSSPVRAGYVAKVVFTGSGAIDTTWDPKQMSRGLVSDGIIRFFGEEKTHVAAKSSDAFAGDTSVTVDLLPGDWNLGDEVVLTGSHFDRYTSPTSSQDELRTITGWTANGYSFSPALAHDHQRAASTHDLHVANLTRNIVFESENPSPVSSRGHVMLRNGDVIIHRTAFVGLGRTDKSIPLDDLVVTQKTNSFEVTEAASPSNRRGRYSLHFHKNGAANPGGTPPSTVHDSVVRDAIGWGFVNHSSHVDFQRNVAYDFVGAGFVTESGDEVGNFIENIAIRGEGDGSFDPIHRFVFASTTRPQPLSDFGFRGDGFWFQGPAITVRDNVASGCDSAGMVWFTTGAPLPDELFLDVDGYQKNKYSHFERSWIDQVYPVGTEASINPRHWLRPGESGTSRIVISDLPILEMDGFEAYGNYVGFRLRFNNSSNNAWYNDGNYDYAVDFIQTSGAVDRSTQTIQNLELWNNQQAFRMRYVDDTDWSNVTAINRLAYDSASKPFAGHDGAEFFHTLKRHEFLDSLVIEGYPVAGRIQHGSNDERGEFTFNGQSYDGYANLDAWHDGLSCTKPSGLAATNVQATSATLSWSSSDPRHSVRYRKTSEQLWTYLGPITTTSTSVTGLSSGSTYEFQVVSGCLKANSGGTLYDTLSAWSTKKTFTTP